MSDSEIQVYLADALDQEACRDTLLTALKSRVASLQARGIPDSTIIDCLENLHSDPDQLNDDVIFEVIELTILSAS